MCLDINLNVTVFSDKLTFNGTKQSFISIFQNIETGLCLYTTGIRGDDISLEYMNCGRGTWTEHLYKTEEGEFSTLSRISVKNCWAG